MEKLYKSRKKPQIHTQKIFHKAFLNLKSFIFVGYKKLHKIPTFNPLRKNNKHKSHELDELFKGFSENWKSNIEQSLKNKKNEVSNSEDDPQIYRQQKTEEKTEKKKKVVLQERKVNELSGENGNKLAKKMKEFEMLEAEDVDHLQDIEEVLDSYSRLTSPVYVEMVDEFFMDMYSEFSIPKPTVTVSRNSSMRRGGSCNSSMRRGGSCNSSMRIVDSCSSSIRRLAPLKL